MTGAHFIETDTRLLPNCHEAIAGQTLEWNTTCTVSEAQNRQLKLPF